MRAIIMTALVLMFMSSYLVSTAHAEKRIIINLASRMLGLYDGNVRLALYPLGVGKVSTPTPTGYYKILTKEIDPPWIDPKNPEYEIPSGSTNPLGYRWMQIKGNYGIHGTNRPDSIGFYVSNGCIRMREADVEDLFDKVQVGTPVEITYNRVVVEKAADDRIAYYIYPDGYNCQPLDVKYVNSWITPWGISAFADDNEIKEEIYKSSGEPVYIGKVYSIEFDGKTIHDTKQNNRHFDSKAVERGGITYLPVVPIAIAMEMKLEWRHHTTLATKYGQVPGIEKKGQLYINEDDANVLFKVEGWKNGNVYKLKPLSPVTEDYNSDSEAKEKDDLNNQGTQMESQENQDQQENISAESQEVSNEQDNVNEQSEKSEVNSESEKKGEQKWL